MIAGCAALQWNPQEHCMRCPHTSSTIVYITSLGWALVWKAYISGHKKRPSCRMPNRTKGADRAPPTIRPPLRTQV